MASRRKSGPLTRRGAAFAGFLTLGVGLGTALGLWLADPTAENVSDPAPKPVAADRRPITTRAYRPPDNSRAAAALPPSATIAPQAPAPDGPALVSPPVATSKTTAPAQSEVGSSPTAALPKATGLQEPAAEPELPLPRGLEAALKRPLAPLIGAPPPPRSPPWIANAVAVPPSTRPMIAIVLDDIGIDQARSRRAIELAAPLTLSFLAYGSNLGPLTEAARERGHELLVHVNMEPMDGSVDPGPNALLTEHGEAEVRMRLAWQLGRFEGYVGINNHMGSRFTAQRQGMEAVIDELDHRGLLFLDSLTTTKSVGLAVAEAYGVPAVVRDVFLDHVQDEDFIRRQLAETEAIAAARGFAIAIGHPYDATLRVLKHWLEDISMRGFDVVPLSAVVRRRLEQG